MKTTLSSLIAVAVISITAPAIAQETAANVAVESDFGAKQHIDLSGRLRMLSQLIPAAACHYVSGIDVDGARNMLETQIAEFDNILNALEFGNAEMGMPYPEERRKTLAEIQALRDLWTPMNTAANAIANDQSTTENLQIVLDQNLAVLAAAQQLVSEIKAEYTNPADMVQADSFLIDIAGRQRMLIQQMLKDSCALSADPMDEAAKAALNTSVQIFSSSIIALRDGMPSAGIRRPPTPEIADQLGVVYNDWNALLPLLETVAAGGSLDVETGARKFQDMNTLMTDMNQIVSLYVAAVDS